MSRRNVWLPGALVLAGALTLPAAAQGQRSVEPAELFNGKGPAGTLALKSLDQNWRRVTINGPEELKGGGVGQLASGFLGAMLGGGAPAMSSYTPPTYTQGATATFGSETFLVVYRPNLKSLDFAALMQAGPGGKLPAPERLTPDTSLTLTLINVRNITSMGDFRPFNLQQELAESAKAAEEEKRLIRQLEENGPGGVAGPDVKTDVAEPDRSPAPAKRPPAKKPAPRKK
jgi:hypothetical protein